MIYINLSLLKPMPNKINNQKNILYIYFCCLQTKYCDIRLNNYRLIWCSDDF